MAHTARPYKCPTAETSASPDEMLDVTIRTVKAFLIDGHTRYEEAFRKNDVKAQMYWDGYIRACYHLMEAHGQ